MSIENQEIYIESERFLDDENRCKIRDGMDFAEQCNAVQDAFIKGAWWARATSEQRKANQPCSLHDEDKDSLPEDNIVTLADIESRSGMEPHWKKCSLGKNCRNPIHNMMGCPNPESCFAVVGNIEAMKKAASDVD